MARKDPMTTKPSAYETGKGNARSGRHASEMPYDPTSPDADEYRRGYNDGVKEKALEDAKKK